MCKIAISCEAVADGNPGDQDAAPGSFFDNLKINPEAEKFIHKHQVRDSLFFIERHWLVRCWIDRVLSIWIKPICIDKSANLDFVIDCCPVRLAKIEAKAKAKVLICNDIPGNLPEDILPVNSWQEVAAIVANTK